MKSSRSASHQALHTVCTVSAAALMLGVSQAATIGINFQVDWTENNAPAYTGTQVTATAFGIAVDGWQNLLPMPTGYNGSGNAPGPFTFNEVIGAGSTDSGLHPLPNGSLNLTWSAVAGNTSGFAGADAPYGGNHPHVGEQEVYYGFMRDDVFIYTHPTSVIGYSVNITGLTSVFTNSTYVIQLVAATDSGNAFTNAIVTSGATTQDLTYTATRDGKGIMGGLSSVSTPLSGDAVAINGAPALSDDDATVWLASTIAGIIITDKPLIEYSPQTPAAPFKEGDSTTLSVTAIGVPPIQYQWRLNGAPIIGATASTYAVNNVTLTNSGFYDVVVSNAYGSATSAAAAVTGDILISTTPPNLILDSSISGSQHNGVNNGTTWLASSLDAAGTNRLGVASFSALTPSQITVTGDTNFDAPQGTIAFWLRSAGTVTNTGNQGAMIFDRRTDNGLVIVQKDDGTISVQPSGTGNAITSTATISDNNWHQVVVIYDQSDTGSVAIYIDGAADSSNSNGSAWTWTPGTSLLLGLSRDAYWRPYDGSFDGFRIYNRMLTDTEVTDLYHGIAVDATVQVAFDFDSPPVAGLALTWLNGSLQTAGTLGGVYADVPSTTSPWCFIPSETQQFFRTQQ